MTRDILNFGLEIKRLIDDCQIPIADVRLIGAGLTFKLTFSKKNYRGRILHPSVIITPH